MRCAKGFAERYGEEHPEYRQQLDYEIDMIEKMGFTDYFLIVADFVNFAKQAGIPVGPGRGSAAGSMVTYTVTDVVAKRVTGPPPIPLDEARKVSPQLREMYEGDERVQTLIETARALEGMPRNTSTHAAGVVITRLPVYDYVPLATNDDTIVTEYTMTTLEELGLLKMDFLGLRNITVIDDAIQEIRKTDPDFSMARVTDNDPKVMDMLTQGKTSGVFQMESSGMTGVCVGLKPQSIEDLSIIVAAYRPGPMDSIPRLIACKNDPKLVQYKHPKHQPNLSDPNATSH